MPWAKPILYEFKMIPKKPSIPDFYIFYDKILYTLYPANTDFTIFPRYVPGPPPLHRFYNEVKFDNKNDLKLVFLLDLKRPGDLRYSLKRHAADQQIRKHLKALRDECPLPVLHAVSAFGTKLRFYKMHHNQLIEPLIPAHPDHVTDTASQNCWNSDILEKEGEKRIKSVVKEIKQACATLRVSESHSA
ncbi:hypothetical protein EDB89DRAFT_1852952 [Lactarius sanguifluus]|nr:hypothetical protein EDB89DRAFT_1852952 [Lactarius sanguifluus]